MEKIYKIDFSNGTAVEKTKSRINRYIIFTDIKGLKIFTRQGVVFLTEQNSEVL